MGSANFDEFFDNFSSFTLLTELRCIDSGVNVP